MKTRICRGQFGCGESKPLTVEYFKIYENGLFDKTCRICRNRYQNYIKKGVTPVLTVYKTVLLKGKSHSERKNLVEQYLKDNDIAYERDKVFDDCPKDSEGNDVVFDFYLSETNTIIEVEQLDDTEQIQVLINPN